MREFFSYYKPHKRLFVRDFTCAVASGLLELAFPLAVKAYVDKLLPSGNWGLILGAAVGLLAIYLPDRRSDTGRLPAGAVILSVVWPSYCNGSCLSRA